MAATRRACRLPVSLAVRDVLLGASTSVLKFNAPAADEVGRHSTALGHCVNHGLRNGTWRTLQKAAIAVGGICQQQTPSNQWLVQRWLADKKRHLARPKSLISGRGPVNRALAKPDEALDLKHSKIKQEWSHEYQPPPSQPLTGSLAATSPVEEIIATVLARPDLLITRNVEWANLAFGFEQQNRYVIIDPRQPQAPVGYILEDSNILLRQLMRTRRPFVASVLDANGTVVFQVRRPIWFINSAIYVEIDGKVIGECHRRWHLWRRNYDVYLGNKQFAAVENPGFWHWTFTLKDRNQGRLAEIDRNWRGFGYEFLTDAGQYMIRFGDTEPLQVSRTLTLLERAVALALAVSLDNDYFSRHSNAGYIF
ncbi:unnamed protein product, partial [Sphagnum jensenii]